MRLPLRAWLIALSAWPLVVGCSAHAQTRPASAPASQPATRPADTERRLYDTPAQAFLDSPEAGRVLDPAKPDAELLAAAVFHETNRVRAAEGLPALQHLDALDAAARMHASDMVAGGFFAHENPRDETRRTPTDRVGLAGIKRPRYVAENIATEFAIRYESGRTFYPSTDRDKPRTFSYTPRGAPIPPHTYASFARKLVDGWMHSPGHRKNILSPSPRALGTACVPATNESGMPIFDGVQVFATP